MALKQSAPTPVQKVRRIISPHKLSFLPPSLPPSLPSPRSLHFVCVFLLVPVIWWSTSSCYTSPSQASFAIVLGLFDYTNAFPSFWALIPDVIVVAALFIISYDIHLHVPLLLMYWASFTIVLSLIYLSYHMISIYMCVCVCVCVCVHATCQMTHTHTCTRVSPTHARTHARVWARAHTRKWNRIFSWQNVCSMCCNFSSSSCSK